MIWNQLRLYLNDFGCLPVAPLDAFLEAED